MGLLRFLERKVYLGDVLREYEPLWRRVSGSGTEQVRFFLVRREGRLQLVIRESRSSVFGAGATYFYVEVTPKLVDVLQEVALDLTDRLER